MRISDWSSDVCSSDLRNVEPGNVIGDTQMCARHWLAVTSYPNAEDAQQSAVPAARQPRTIQKVERIDTRDQSHQKTNQQVRERQRDTQQGARHGGKMRSEERRAGKEGVSRCRYRG